MEKSGENPEDELVEVTVLRSLELAGGAYFQICPATGLIHPRIRTATAGGGCYSRPPNTQP